MLWLTPPPYWRWLAAAALIAVAAYMDLSGPPMEKYPFVAEAVGSGEPIVVEWRDVPRGMLPPPGGLSGAAHEPLVAGTPLVNGLLETASTVPADWWAVAVELPATATAGSDVMITTRAPSLQVVGIVVTPPTGSGFGPVSPGLVAFPPDQAAPIAAALAEHRATILVRP